MRRVLGSGGMTSAKAWIRAVWGRGEPCSILGFVFHIWVLCVEMALYVG